MAVQQCPACELRFSSERELEFHLHHDHGDRGEALAGTLAETREERRRARRRRERSAVHRPRPPT